MCLERARDSASHTKRTPLAPSHTCSPNTHSVRHPHTLRRFQTHAQPPRTINDALAGLEGAPAESGRPAPSPPSPSTASLPRARGDGPCAGPPPPPAPSSAAVAATRGVVCTTASAMARLRLFFFLRRRSRRLWRRRRNAVIVFGATNGFMDLHNSQRTTAAPEGRSVPSCKPRGNAQPRLPHGHPNPSPRTPHTMPVPHGDTF